MNDMLSAAIEDLAERAMDCAIENLQGIDWRVLAGSILNARASAFLSSLPAETLTLIRDGMLNVPAVLEGVEAAAWSS